MWIKKAYSYSLFSLGFLLKARASHQCQPLVKEIQKLQYYLTDDSKIHNINGKNHKESWIMFPHFNDFTLTPQYSSTVEELIIAQVLFYFHPYKQYTLYHT